MSSPLIIEAGKITLSPQTEGLKQLLATKAVMLSNLLQNPTPDGPSFFEVMVGSCCGAGLILIGGLTASAIINKIKANKPDYITTFPLGTFEELQPKSANKVEVEAGGQNIEKTVVKRPDGTEAVYVGEPPVNNYDHQASQAKIMELQNIVNRAERRLNQLKSGNWHRKGPEKKGFGGRTIYTPHSTYTEAQEELKNAKQALKDYINR